MCDAGRDLQAIAGIERGGHAIMHHGGNPRKNVEKLPGLFVSMLFLGGPGGHAFLNNRHLRRLQEIPAIAAVSPGIMLGGFYIRRHAKQITSKNIQTYSRQKTCRLWLSFLIRKV